MARIRVKFYGLDDGANYSQNETAAAMLLEHSTESEIRNLNDAIELHNVLEFEYHRLLLDSFSEEEPPDLAGLTKRLKKQLAEYFAQLNTLNIQDDFSRLESNYADDLLVLLVRYDFTRKVGAVPLVDALEQAQIPLSVMLANRKFVEQCDVPLREALLSDATNAELLIREKLLEDSRSVYYFPRSLTKEDSRDLLQRYITSDAPHLNYVQAVTEAHDKNHRDLGIDPKLRLEAKRRQDALARKLLTTKRGVTMTTSTVVRFDDKQIRSAVFQNEPRADGRDITLSIGTNYLLRTLGPAQILQNFADVFCFQNRLGLLQTPSFESDVSAIQRLFVTGKDAYLKSQNFERMDGLTLQGTYTYYEFLHDQDIDVEETVAWFFNEHIVSTFGAPSFRYHPSSPNTSFLEKCRHVAPEMESITKQFTLYCENGELDFDLLQMTSGTKSWHAIPSLVQHKYLHQTDNPECSKALFLLFNDQSGLRYINDQLKAPNFEQLITAHEVHHTMLSKPQKSYVEFLAEAGLLTLGNEHIDFTNSELILLLSDIYRFRAGAYGHYGIRERNSAHTLVTKNWLTLQSRLLTPPEASYFNYYLNKKEFSNGPDLRNSYAHGSNTDPNDVEQHEQSFMRLLRLLIMLTLKIQDDFTVATKIDSPPYPPN